MAQLDPDTYEGYDLIALQAYLEDTLNHELATWQQSQANTVVTHCIKCADLVYIFHSLNKPQGIMMLASCRGFRYPTEDTDDIITFRQELQRASDKLDRSSQDVLKQEYCPMCGSGTTLVGRGCWYCKVGTYANTQKMRNKVPLRKS